MPCHHCPVRPGLACPGEAHTPFCRDMDAGLPGRAEQVVALAEGRPVPGAVDGPSRPPSDLEVRLAMAAETCPSGSGNCGCGGKPRSCGREGRPSEVFRRDCVSCQTADWWEAGGEAR